MCASRILRFTVLVAVLLVALWPGAVNLRAAEASASRPNILIILADDLGYSDLGCYGSEIATPNLDRLARSGLRFTQFYNTARCWPTRAALMTGYYPQQVRMDPPQGRCPEWTRTLPQLLEPFGYRSYHAGKWHVMGVPRTCADGGFDHSYRLEDHDRNFNPRNLIEDDQKLPAVPPNSGYYTATAFADHMIGYLKEHAAKHSAGPFFAYLAFTTPHFPLQAPPEDIARYRDKYLAGWEVIRAGRYEQQRELGIVDSPLSLPEPRIRAPSGKPGVERQVGFGEIAYALPWGSLTDEQKRFQATKMSIHAAMVDRIDHEVGRVLGQIRAMGALDNTVIFFLSDNGASAEILIRGDGNDPAAASGSAGSFLCLGPGWSTVSNTPFRRHKIWVHEGGISTPLVVHWPKGITARGELRRQVGHVIDFAPTLLELAGAKSDERPSGAPPFPGRSLVPAFAKSASSSEKAPICLFFHHENNRALRVGDWKIVSASVDGGDWYLYDLSNDRAEGNNLAARYPERVREMSARWQQLEVEFRRDAGTDASTNAVGKQSGTRK
ncbi:MAG TPA: arylsulfatase [Verrucomicrobiae bacterium]